MIYPHDRPILHLGAGAEDDEGPQLLSGFSRPIQQRLRRAFTIKGMLFFDFYGLLKSINRGLPVPDDLKRQFRIASNRLSQVTSPVDGKGISPVIANQIAEIRPEVERYFNRLVQQGELKPNHWRMMNEMLVPLYLAVARDKGVYLKAMQRGVEQWAIFRPMTGKQETHEKMRDTDPETFELVERYHTTLENIDQAIKETIQDQGLEVQEGFMMGRPVTYGIDSKTGEKMVYDRDGDILTPDEYKDKRREKQKADARLALISTRTEVPLKKMRMLTSGEADALEGEAKWSALTDDVAKQGKLSRIFPTKTTDIPIQDEDGNVLRYESVKVIVGGRYKGIFLDDMVNGLGRMIEGTAYTYSPLTGRKGMAPKRIDPSQREPYTTVAEVTEKMVIRGKKVSLKKKKLFLRISGQTADKELRNGIKALSCNVPAPKGNCIPSISYHKVAGSRAAEFYFDPKDFATIMDNLAGMSLSTAAMTMMQDYNKEQAYADKAVTDDNLKYYSADAIGGFKPRAKLLTKQKQAIAWLESNGGSGVCALDTGIGKCVREDTLISTDRGLVPIKELNPGLIEPDATVPVDGWSVVVGGKTLPVKNFYFGGLKPTIRVITRRGYEVEGSRIHPLLVRTPDGHETWVQTPDLESGDFLCVEKGGQFPENDPVLSVPVKDGFQQQSRNPDKTFTSPHVQVFPVPDRMSPEMGRLLGYIVAEGWTNHRRYFTISQCPEKNPTVRVDIEDLLKSQLGWEAKPDKDILVQSLFLREYLSRMGVGMGVAKDKTVPPIVFKSSRETVRQFLKAFIDAEGSVDGGRSWIEFSTASEQLGREVQILLLQFGILCTRSPKKVKGYDHTYWRVTITGEDAKTYWDTIGFISQRKQAALNNMPDTRNENLDVVPHLAVAVGSLFDAGLERSGLSVSRVREQQGNTFDITICHIRKGRRNPTYPFLQRLLSWASDYGCQDHPAFNTILGIVERNLFYDPIKKLEESEAVVMDIEVDDPSHCFVGNGLVNHNTLTSIAMMQKQLRDGMAEEGASYTTPDGEEVETNGRFLYVCPKSLRGNLPSQIQKFMEEPGILRDKVDILTYAQFGTGQMKGKIPKHLKNRPFWKDRKRFDAKYYISIYFDEAHALKGENQASKGALKLWHPRKVCMTASPMDKEPMEAYILAAVSNNTRLFKMTGDSAAQTKAVRDAQAVKRRFKKRYCETVGGDVVGVKEDASTKRELDQWIKRNVFYAEKTAVEEFELGEPTRTPIAVEMNPVVENAYKALTGQFSKTMLGLAKKWKDRGGPGTGGADVKRIARREFKPVIQLMRDLSNRPEKAMLDIAMMVETNKTPDGDPIPAILRRVVTQWREKASGSELRDAASKMENPKLDVAEKIITSKLSETERGPNPSRAILFTDDQDFCMDAVKFLGQKMGGKIAVALKDQILIYRGTTALTEVVFERSPGMVDRLLDPSKRAEFEKTGNVSVIPLPLRRKAYKRHQEVRKNNTDNRYYKPDDWQQFAFEEAISPDQGIKAMVLLGTEYSYGHNLQAFDTVIHLDRDGGQSETMKQRTARAWRQGQKNPVDEFTLDATYSADDPDGTPRDEYDLTLDQINAAKQAVGKDVFDKIMLESMGTDLGGQWAKMVQQNASLANMDKKVMELLMSPYVGRSDEPGVK